MTSKCGKNKKVAHEAIAECVTDVLKALETLTRSRIRENHAWEFSTTVATAFKSTMKRDKKLPDMTPSDKNLKMLG